MAAAKLPMHFQAFHRELLVFLSVAISTLVTVASEGVVPSAIQRSARTRVGTGFASSPACNKLLAQSASKCGADPVQVKPVTLCPPVQPKLRKRARALQLFARSANLEIGVGSVSLTALMINRLATLDLANAQSRADLLGVAVASALLVSAFARIDLTVREKESVKLAGVDFDDVLVALPGDGEALLRYAGELILQVSEPARSVVIFAQGTTVARLGTMGRAQELKLGPIVGDAMAKRSQQYLADLQILPGRVEFQYLPINTQAVLVQPIGEDGVMVVGADKVRPFTARDLVVIERLEPLLRSALQGG